MMMHKGVFQFLFTLLFGLDCLGQSLAESAKQIKYKIECNTVKSRLGGRAPLELDCSHPGDLQNLLDIETGSKQPKKSELSTQQNSEIPKAPLNDAKSPPVCTVYFDSKPLNPNVVNLKSEEACKAEVIKQYCNSKYKDQSVELSYSFSNADIEPLMPFPREKAKCVTPQVAKVETFSCIYNQKVQGTGKYPATQAGADKCKDSIQTTWGKNSSELQSQCKRTYTSDEVSGLGDSNKSLKFQLLVALSIGQNKFNSIAKGDCPTASTKVGIAVLSETGSAPVPVPPPAVPAIAH